VVKLVNQHSELAKLFMLALNKRSRSVYGNNTTILPLKLWNPYLCRVAKLFILFLKLFMELVKLSKKQVKQTLERGKLYHRIIEQNNSRASPGNF
jgi:hypothetical protein